MAGGGLFSRKFCLPGGEILRGGGKIYFYTGPGPEHLEHLFKVVRVVQDGDPRDNKNLPTGRGMGHIHRRQGCILPYTNSQSVQEVHALSHPGSVLPVQSPTLWPVHSTHGVHSGGQRGQTHGTSEGYKDPPLPR